MGNSDGADVEKKIRKNNASTLIPSTPSLFPSPRFFFPSNTRRPDMLQIQHVVAGRRMHQEKEGACITAAKTAAMYRLAE